MLRRSGALSMCTLVRGRRSRAAPHRGAGNRDGLRSGHGEARTVSTASSAVNRSTNECICYPYHAPPLTPRVASDPQSAASALA